MKRFRSYSTVASVLAGLLLAGSLLKGYSLLTSPPIERGLLTSPRFLFAVAESELVLALWLWSGLFPIAAWWAATVCFLTFLATSLTQGLAGERSCGCFGPLPVAPWLMVFVDAGAVCLLAVAELPKSRQGTLSWHSRRLAPVAILGFVLGGGGLIGFLQAGPSALLNPSTSLVDFGSVSRSSYREMPFLLTNPGPSTVRLVAVASTCPCLTIHLEHYLIDSGETVSGLARLDLGQEPDYVGRLAVDIYGRTEANEIAFRMVVTVQVE